MKKHILKIRFAAVALALSCAVGVGIASAATATIDLSSEKQLIRGFGGMNHPLWTDDLTAAQREKVFGNGENQLGFTVLRIPVPENQSDWTRVLPTAKDAYSRGHIVFASPWNPPAGMTETFTHSSDKTSPKRLKASSYAAYAKHLDDFVTYMKTNGAPLTAISVQNEPDYADEWTWWTPAEMITFLKNNASAINCKIIAPESFQYIKSTSDPILNDAQALAQVDIVGTHLYGTQVSQFPYPLFKSKGAGKELWMTEVYTPNSEANSADKWPEALDVAQHVHNAMVEAEFQMYVWWYIRRSYSPLKEDGNISKRGWMMAHFSKFVRPGYVRVDATKSPETDVFVSAYKGDGKVAIVAVNKKTSAVNQTFAVNGGSALTKMEGWRTTETVNMAKIADVGVSGGNFTTSLPARSVTTFVGALGSGGGEIVIPPDVNISCALGATYAVAGDNVPRPDVGCGEGITPGTASFSISGSDLPITGWVSPGGTHQFYNLGERTVTLNSLECGGVNVTPPTPVLCGTIKIVSDVTTSIAKGNASAHKPFSVNVRGKTLFITAASPTIVEIYNIKGGKETSFNVSGTSQAVKLSLSNGIYFAKVHGLRDVRFVVR